MKSSQSVGLRMVKKPDLVSVPRQRECCPVRSLWLNQGQHTCMQACTRTLSHTLSCAHTHTPTLVCTHTLTHTLSLLHLDTVTLSCMHTHFHTHTHSLLCLHTLSLLCTHNTHFLSYSDSLSLSLSHTHTHTHKQNTHKQTKTKKLSSQHSVLQWRSKLLCLNLDMS